MKSLYIVRHGKSEANEFNDFNVGNRLFGGATESALSKKGSVDVEQLGQALQRQGVIFDKVLSSPLERAHRTTEIILSQTQPDGATPITFVDALKERSLGMISGLTAQQIYDLYPQLREDLEQDPQLRHLRETFEETPEGIESYSAVEKRLKAELTPILQDRAPSKILIVSHKHTIRCLIHWLLDESATTTQQDITELDVPNAKAIVLQRVIPRTPRFIMSSGLLDAWRKRPLQIQPDTDVYLPHHLERAYTKLYADMGLIEYELYEKRCEDTH